MSNVYINLPCSAGTANGALTAVSTQASKKTMVVTGHDRRHRQHPGHG
jgi:hypothetical protein